MAMLKLMLVLFGVLFVLMTSADWLFFANSLLSVTQELQCAAVGSIIVSRLFAMTSPVTNAIAQTARRA